MAQNLDLNINVNTDQAGKSVGSLKTQLKQAQAEVAALSDKFGATSKEAIEAAKRAGELKDRIGDAKALTEAFNPDAKFKALTASLSGVAGGFAAVQGAMSLFGSESEDVQKTLLKVQSAMALSQGLQAVGESVDSFKQLGAVIKSTTVFQELNNAATATASVVQRAFGVATVQTSNGFKVLKGAIIATGFGALVVLLGTVIAKFDAISDWIKKSPLGALAKGVGALVEQFTDFIGVTSEAERSLNKLSSANKRANEDIENRIKVLKAQGGSEKEIYDLSQQRINNELNSLRASLKTKGKLTEEEQKQMRDLNNEKLVLTADYNKKTADANAKAAEDASKKTKEEREKINKENQEAREEAEAQEKYLLDLELKYYEKRVEQRKKINAEIIGPDGLTDKERIKKVEDDQKAKEEYAKKMQEFNEESEKNGLGKILAIRAAADYQSIKDAEETFAAKARIDELEKQSKLANAYAISDIVSGLSNLIGQESAAGKGIAVASATIDTYLSASSLFKNASANPITIVNPAYPYLVAAPAVLSGIARVKQIMAVSIPKGGSGGGSVPSISTQAPMVPQLPAAQTTNISRESINDLGNQAVRAYVIETDVTGNQQRMAAIRQRARFS
jgi:hypothetical protein